MFAFHPLIRLRDWYGTSEKWRETRKAIPGQLGREALAVVKKLAAEGAGEEGGNNRGKWIERFGGKQGASWCGWLIHHAIEQACLRLGRSDVPVVRTGGARKLFRSAAKAGYLVTEKDVKGGDLILFDRGVIGRPGDAWKAHIGIMDDDTGYYWAGNEGPNAKVERHKLTPAKRKRLEGWARLP
jgi:hypothetical protein